MALPPHSDPGRPDSRGPGRYLWWLLRRQPGRVVLAVLLSSAWMSGVVVEPLFIQGAIDHGLIAGDRAALGWWSAALAAVVLVTMLIGMQRHRTMTFLRVDAGYRTVQVVTRHVARLGAGLPRRVATGEVVTVGTTDIWQMSMALTMAGPGLGAVVALVVVAALVLTISPLLGTLILLGVPAVALVVGPLLGRLQRTEADYRHRQGELTARAGDIVSGLRVLRGIGGEGMFADRYRRRSQALRAEGYRVGAVTSWVRALSTGLPALFVTLVTWLAARMAVQQEITVGELVAIYAYAAVLTVPVGFLIDSGYLLVRGRVAARRVVNLLNLHPELPEDQQPTAGATLPTGPALLHDPESGLRVPPGQLLAVAVDDQAAGLALANRLGRYQDSEVTYGGTALARVPLPAVRERIMVAEGEAYLFAGVLRDLLTPPTGSDQARITRALQAAAADEVVAELPGQLAASVGNQASSLSGGQRQRIRLARALLADPEVLILVEPTSAVDAHTEAAIAAQLPEVRAGRTTIVLSASPLLADRADQVAFLAGGRVAATGTHAELLATCPEYRQLVARGGGAPVPAAAGRESLP